MTTEYEATFRNIDKDDIRTKLKAAGATLIKPEFMQKRAVFYMPEGHEIPGGWLRVRDEGDQITMSLKVVVDGRIEDQKEIMFKVDDFDEAKEFLTLLGCKYKAYQESKRELWKLDGAEVTIDEWPFLEPYVEVEAHSEQEVQSVSGKLGFDYSKAIFSAVDYLYHLEYGIDKSVVNATPKIVFDMENPFSNLNPQK